MIICGKLELGEPVSESQLGAYFKISKTPVREALQRLEQDRLIVMPRKGTFVFSTNKSDCVHLCLVRTALGQEAMREVYERDKARLISQLIQCMNEAEDAFKSEPGILENHLINDFKLHQTILLSAANTYLIKAY